MGSIFSAENLIIVAVVSLLAFVLSRLSSAQNRRVEWLERTLNGSGKQSSCRSLPLSSMLPPQENQQPVYKGVVLPGGLMWWRGNVDVAELVSGVILSRRTPGVFLGESCDGVVRALAQKALALGQDPRGRLFLPVNVEELRFKLENEDLSCPWIVADLGRCGAGDALKCQVESLISLHGRFGCPVILLNCLEPEAEWGFVALGEADT